MMDSEVDHNLSQARYVKDRKTWAAGVLQQHWLLRLLAIARMV